MRKRNFSKVHYRLVLGLESLHSLVGFSLFPRKPVCGLTLRDFVSAESDDGCKKQMFASF